MLSDWPGWLPNLIARQVVLLHKIKHSLDKSCSYKARQGSRTVASATSLRSKL
jgi:hypothetical protein